MKRLLLSLLSLLSLIPISLSQAQPLPIQPPPPKGSSQNDATTQVEQAIREALDARRPAFLAPTLYETEVENVRLALDGQAATGWLVLTDPHSGEALPTEPGLALAQQSGESWQVTLPGEPAWEALLQELPGDLISDAMRAEWLAANQEPPPQAQQAAAIGGYLLPWEAGKTVWLSRSVTHVKDYSTAYYAWDFYISKQMYNLFAARGGTVWMAYDEVPNNNNDQVNYLVLKDTTTEPDTYQLYLHLAQGSIPKALKTVGASVVQGQFIGIADNTGASTGHHLHFHVYSSPTWSYWGPSIDITFDDVAINGGRPRRTDELDDCKSGDNCTAGANSYVSGNIVRIGPTPPIGDILEPSNGSTLSSNLLHLEGWAQDEDSGLDSAQFIANFGDGWLPVGSPFSTALFEMDWDLCASGVPDGPVSVALQLRDKAGSQTTDLVGLKHFTKNFTCAPPPPACAPGPDQVALFANPDYGGVCTLLGAGSYNDAAALGALGSDNAASILVGGDAQATLYSLDNKTGRSETFQRNDANLAENRIGANTVSSVLVQSRAAAPVNPEVEATTPGVAAPAAPAAVAAPLPVPFSDNMENGVNGWVNGGNWSQVNVPDVSRSWRYGANPDNYNTGAKNSGTLTSPALAIPSLESGTYYLRFRYLYETEGSGLHWDQRRIQISQDGGAFTDVLQLATDEPNLWLQSPAIDLKPYAGHTILVRFLFDTVDATLNSYKGWYIDDVTVTANAPASCADAGEPNDSASTATPMSTNASLNGVICPGGDVDFYKFNGKAGDQIGAWVDAQAAGSKLDSYLFLLAEDGTSVLASNDDQQASVRSDSSLAYVLRRDGVYYLKVRAWDHPSAGGSDYGYTLRLFEEKTDPSAHFNGLTGNHLMAGDTVTLSVSADDAGSGVSHVEFLWHSNDWQTGEWKVLGEDWTGSDGWSCPFKLGDLPPQTGLALYARAYDWAGNSYGTGVWELGKAAALNYFPVIFR